MQNRKQFVKYTDAIKFNPFKIDDWRYNFYRYMCLREGVVQNVYLDSKGLPTIGIGNYLTKDEIKKFPAGTILTMPQIVDMFKRDIVSHKLDYYTNELYYPSIQKKVALASFLFAHGDGQYKKSNLRKLLTSQHTEQQIRDNLKSWDKTSPVNIKRNRADFDLYFTGKSVLGRGTYIIELPAGLTEAKELEKKNNKI